MNHQRTSAFLMANLGAEVSRILSAKEKSDERLMRECFERAIKILKEIMTIPDMKKRGEEMHSLSNLISDIISPNPSLRVSRRNISAYFMPFASRVIGEKTQGK